METPQAQGGGEGSGGGDGACMRGRDVLRVWQPPQPLGRTGAAAGARAVQVSPESGLRVTTRFTADFTTDTTTGFSTAAKAAAAPGGWAVRRGDGGAAGGCVWGWRVAQAMATSGDGDGFVDAIDGLRIRFDII